MIQKTAPIGLFDSGLGGLTVFRALQDLLPEESLYYLGDTARVPYGTKSGETVLRYSRENAAFLRGEGIKALVVACNTSSAYALHTLQDECAFPVVGVILPGVDAALTASTSKRIGVIATAATAMSQAYEQGLRACHPDCHVVTQACPLLVPLVEEGWMGHAVTREVLAHYLAPLQTEEVDTLILGCTHYPLVAEVIQDLMGPDVALIDSGRAAAHEMAQRLRREALQAPAGAVPTHRCAVTDTIPQFITVAETIMHGPLPPVTTVSLPQ
jgi:glutamate racemase